MNWKFKVEDFLTFLDGLFFIVLLPFSSASNWLHGRKIELITFLEWFIDVENIESFFFSLYIPSARASELTLRTDAIMMNLNIFIMSFMCFFFLVNPNMKFYFEFLIHGSEDCYSSISLCRHYFLHSFYFNFFFVNKNSTRQELSTCFTFPTQKSLS